MTNDAERATTRTRLHDAWRGCRWLAARLVAPYSSAVIPLEWPRSPNRIDFLNAILERGEKSSYLEIGCRADDCFSRIRATRKVGVDPRSGGTVRATSDAFFSRNAETFDLIFIDGLHVYRQVMRDIRNSLAALAPGGLIVLHDCLPLTWAAQCPWEVQEKWNGDVWRAFIEVRTWSHVDAATCLIDHGLGVVVPRPNTGRLAPPSTPFDALPFAMLAADYTSLLRTLDYESGLRFALEDRAG